MAVTLLWFRRDLRLFDHPALLATGDAAEEGAGGGVVGTFVLDPILLRGSGRPRVAFLLGALRELAAAIDAAGGRLVRRS